MKYSRTALVIRMTMEMMKERIWSSVRRSCRTENPYMIPKLTARITPVTLKVMHFFQ